MAKVERILVAEGGWFLIECAVRKDLSSPVGEFLRELRDGEHDLIDQEPDEQVRWHDWFVAACEYLAETGDPPHRSYNQLMDGMWEIKHASLRVSFYDTDGSGHFTPKVDRTMLGPYEHRAWPEDFAEVLRLTSAFEKTGQKTNPREIGFAKLVRMEDAAHDREATSVSG